MGGGRYAVSFLESIIYGFISGLTEFLPVSPQGHQALMMRLFGVSVREPVRDMFVHIAILIALVSTCKSLFSRISSENRLSNHSRTRRGPVRSGVYDFRLVKAAAIPLIACLFFYFTGRKFESNYIILALFFIINGIVIIIPEYARHGNKDARFMAGWDGMIYGLMSNEKTGQQVLSCFFVQKGGGHACFLRVGCLFEDLGKKKRKDCRKMAKYRKNLQVSFDFTGRQA